LTPASGRQNHTTSPSASRAIRQRRQSATASRPAFVTIASRPSCRGGTVRLNKAASTPPSSANSENPKFGGHVRHHGQFRWEERSGLAVIPGWCASTRPGISRFSGAQLRTIVRSFHSRPHAGPRSIVDLSMCSPHVVAHERTGVLKIFAVQPKKTLSTLSALFGHGAMSELSLLSGLNRTSRLRPPTSEFDPKWTFADAPSQTSPPSGSDRKGRASKQYLHQVILHCVTRVRGPFDLDQTLRPSA